jgi:outer membrane protein
MLMFSLSSLASRSWLRICACALLTSFLWNATAGQDGNSSSSAAAITQSLIQDNHAQVSAQAPFPNDGRLYLTLQQAISMALRNNLDIQLEQLDQNVANSSLERTEGGGTPRAITYNVAEAPVGAATAAVPLFSSLSTLLTPTSVDPAGVNVFSSYDKSHITETERSLSIGTTPFSPGSPVPAYNGQLLGQFGWLRRDPAPSLAFISPSAANAADKNVTDNTLGSFTYAKGFSSGASVQLGVNNFIDSFYSGRTSAVPFSHPNAFALALQPLLRGAGRSNNTRYIAIAKTNKNISEAVLEQQMISTISGVANLYYDLVSLQQSVRVQEQALKAAEELLSNDRQQFAVGRMPPIEVSRAEALVAADRLGLEQSRALKEQQQIVLRSVIDPQSLAKEVGEVTEIVATDQLSSPTDAQQPSLAELIALARSQRPDFRQARLQVSNGERMVAASQNALRPELDLYGEFQTRGVVIPGLVPLGGDSVTGAAVLDPIPTGGIRASRVYEAGIQFNLPVRNRVAAGDLGADLTQLRQQRLRVTQMEAQVSAEVRNAVTALNAAKKAAEAAASSRKLQQELWKAETEKFQAGFSTNFNLIQQQAYLAQSETTEVVARAAWQKAVVQLDRAVGQTLQHRGIALNPDSKGGK